MYSRHPAVYSVPVISTVYMSLSTMIKCHLKTRLVPDNKNKTLDHISTKHYAI